MYRHNNIPMLCGKYSLNGGNYTYTDTGNIGAIFGFATGKKLLPGLTVAAFYQSNRLFSQHNGI